MPTTIRVNIAQGYRPQVDAYVEARPGVPADQALRQWVEHRYGDWIARNLTEDYSVHRVSLMGFDVVFEEAEHARVFREAIGGQEVAHGA